MVLARVLPGHQVDQATLQGHAYVLQGRAYACQAIGERARGGKQKQVTACLRVKEGEIFAHCISIIISTI